MNSTLFNLLAETGANNPGGLFMPIRASSVAEPVDHLMWFINAVAVFFTLLIFVLTVYFCWKFHHSKNPVAKPTGHNNVLELTWTAIPTVIVFVMFFWGFFVYMKMFAPAAERQTAEVNIRVEGYKWGWRFYYRHPVNGREVMSPKLFMPKGQVVRFEMNSIDVIHSLYLPSMRMKKDVVPGRFNKMEVTPVRAGVYDVFCTEYCGDNHSKMLTTAEVFEDVAGFNKAVINAGILEVDPADPTVRFTAPELGLKVATINGCFSCHSNGDPKNNANIGPSWVNLFGKTESFVGGSTGVADENYIIESIRYPARKIVESHPGQMSPYGPGNISDRQISYLIAYMKTLSDKAPKQDWPKVEPPKEGEE
jgi:cytochrome c oxidase subunit II